MRFYVLKPDGMRYGDRWAYGTAAAPKDIGSFRRCPECQLPISLREWLPPHYIELSSVEPSKLGDFLWGSGFQTMISGAAHQLFINASISGIEQSYPPVRVVEVTNLATLEAIDQMSYRLVRWMWGSANLDDERSQVVRKNSTCTYCRGSIRSLDGLYLDENTWDGTDVFTPRGLFGEIVVSNRAAQVMKEHSVSNARLIPAERYVYDEELPGLWREKGSSTNDITLTD